MAKHQSIIDFVNSYSNGGNVWGNGFVSNKKTKAWEKRIAAENDPEKKRALERAYRGWTHDKKMRMLDNNYASKERMKQKDADFQKRMALIDVQQNDTVQVQEPDAQTAGTPEEVQAGKETELGIGIEAGAARAVDDDYTDVISGEIDLSEEPPSKEEALKERTRLEGQPIAEQSVAAPIETAPEPEPEPEPAKQTALAPKHDSAQYDKLFQDYWNMRSTEEDQTPKKTQVPPPPKYKPDNSWFWKDLTGRSITAGTKSAGNIAKGIGNVLGQGVQAVGNLAGVLDTSSAAQKAQWGNTPGAAASALLQGLTGAAGAGLGMLGEGVSGAVEGLGEAVGGATSERGRIAKMAFLQNELKQKMLDYLEQLDKLGIDINDPSVEKHVANVANSLGTIGMAGGRVA